MTIEVGHKKQNPLYSLKGRNLPGCKCLVSRLALLLLRVELGVEEMQQQVNIHLHLGEHLLDTHTLILELKKFLHRSKFFLIKLKFLVLTCRGNADQKTIPSMTNYSPHI